MKLSERLRFFFKKEVFIPSWISVIINPNYFVSKGISSGIKRNTQYLTGKMLDFGCGHKPYKSLFKVEDYIGVDIKNTGHHNDTSSVDVFYDGKNLPFDSESFDSIFSTEVLTHIFNIEEIIPELKRVLKKDGYFLLTVPFVWKENEKPNDSVRYTSFGINHLLEKNGFEVIKNEKSGHYLVAIFQLFNNYIYSAMPQGKILKLLLTLLIVFPINVLGIILSAILPTNPDLFLNNILVARKK